MIFVLIVVNFACDNSKSTAFSECTQLKNSVALEREVCDGETMRFEFMICPTLFSTYIAIVRNKTAFSNENYVIYCEQIDKTVSCSPKNEGTYNKTTNILHYKFTFNRTRFDGRFLRITTNTSCSAEDVQFYPLKQRSKFFEYTFAMCKNHYCRSQTCIKLIWIWQYAIEHIHKCIIYYVVIKLTLSKVFSYDQNYLTCKHNPQCIKYHDNGKH